MLRKKLIVFISSFKSSAEKRPMALLMLFISVVVAFISCGLMSRMFVSSVESGMYSEMYIDLTRDFDFDKATAEMVKLRSEGALALDAVVTIHSRYFNVEMINAKGEKIISNGRIYYPIFGDKKYISEEMIFNKERVVVANEAFLKTNNASVGEEILINNVPYIISDIDEDNSDEFLNIRLPYTAKFPFEEVYYNSYSEDPEGSNLLTYGKSSMRVYNLNRRLNAEETERLRVVGVVAEHYPMFQLFLLPPFALIIVVALVNVANLLSIVRFWMKANDKKYAVYKMLGIRQGLLGGIMYFEGMIMILLGLGAGIGIEMALTKAFLSGFPIKNFLAAHYCIVIFVVFVASLLPLSIKVAQRAKLGVGKKKTKI